MRKHNNHMKPKLILTILSLVAVVIGSAFMLSYLMSPGAGKLPPALDDRPAAPHYAQTSAPTKTEPITPAPNPAPQTLAAAAVATNLNPAELTGDAREEYIRQRTEELDDLSSDSDPISRDKILAELQNPLKEVREAALQATINFNNRSVVPRLRELAELTEDPREKASILDAIDYINLPSLTERRLAGK